MKKSLLHRLAFFCIAITAFSCNLGSEDPVDISEGSSFYPLEIGSFAIYDVISVDYNEFIDNDTSIFQLKEVISDTFSVEGMRNYRVERYTRPNPDIQWVIDSVWSIRVDEGRLVKTESNIPYIKLMLPVGSVDKWNGNVFNSFGFEEYNLHDLGKSYQVGEEIFNNTAKVLQELDTTSLFSRTIEEEVFAENVGLIHKASLFYQYPNKEDHPDFGTQKILQGHFLEQKVIDWGVE